MVLVRGGDTILVAIVSSWSIWKKRTVSWSDMACWLNSSEVPESSSAAAAVPWVVWVSCSIEMLICSRPEVCSREAAEISWTRSAVLRMEGTSSSRRDPAFSGHSIFIVCCRRNREHLLRCRFRCQIVFRLSDLFAFPVPKGLLFWQVFCRLSVREFVSLPSFERLQTFFNKRKLSRKNAHAPQHCARRLRQP